MAAKTMNLSHQKSDNSLKHGSQAAVTTVSNEDLVKGCCAGDRNSQRLLFKKYRDVVFFIVSHNLGPNYDKDDIIQQIFIKIYRSLENFKGLSSLDTWVYRIAAKVCIDQLRKKYRKRKIDIISNPELLEQRSDPTRLNPAKDCEDKELSEQIVQGLHKLSAEKRMVVTMFEMEGFSLEEVAQILDKPIGTIKSRLFHGRKELASHLRTYMDKK